MSDPTSLIPVSSTGAEISEQLAKLAKLESDEDSNTLAPKDYIYLLAHIPVGTSLIEPFYCSDQGSMQLLGTVTQQRSQAGLVLNDATRSITLEYYPDDTPTVVFFGAEIDLDVNQLRGGIVVPKDYDGKHVYKLNVFYNVKFYRIRHTPNHPELISEADGGILWEDFQGSGDLKSWPIEYQVEYA